MITFIAPAYKEILSNRTLVDSLIMQEDTKWKLIVFHNGENKEMKEWVDSYKDNRIIYHSSSKNTGFYGTYNRKKALEFIDTEYVVQTSIQDYYMTWATKLINSRLKETDADFCMWDSINHLAGYEPLDVKLEQNYIDWGNFCLKTYIAKWISIPYPEEYCADWLTLRRGIEMDLFKKQTKIANILTIHN